MNEKFKLENNSYEDKVNEQIKDNNEKRCLLCNKPYDTKNELFGSECLMNMYELLNIPMPSWSFRNKENYLCTKVAHINNKFFLGKKNKYIITEKYIALNYLDKIGYSSFDDIKNKLINDIKKISIFSTSTSVYELNNFVLHDVYLAYNMWNKFNNLIDEVIKELDIINDKDRNEDDDVKDAMEGLLNKFKFIFDKTKVSNPIFYSLLYEMQYKFWEVVVAGGILSDKKISAKFLLHSLVPYGKTIENLIINDRDIIDRIIKEKVFITKINEAIIYCSNKKEFDSKKFKNFDNNIEYNNNDLFYSLHNASIYIKGKKTIGNSWNLEIEIKDTYDFTDIKNLKEYTTSNNSKATSVLSSTLNNFGIVSQQYGVLKRYDIIIKFKMDNYVVDWK